MKKSQKIIWFIIGFLVVLFGIFYILYEYVLFYPSRIKIGDALLQIKKEGYGVLHCDRIGYSNKLYDNRFPRRLLTDSLVDYGEVKLSPGKTKAAFIDYVERQKPTHDLKYRLMVYYLDTKTLQPAVIAIDNQLAMFDWVNNTTLRYSFEYDYNPNQKWLVVEIK